MRKIFKYFYAEYITICKRTWKIRKSYEISIVENTSQGAKLNYKYLISLSITLDILILSMEILKSVFFFLFFFDLPTFWIVLILLFWFAPRWKGGIFDVEITYQTMCRSLTECLLDVEWIFVDFKSNCKKLTHLDAYLLATHVEHKSITEFFVFSKEQA